MLTSVSCRSTKNADNLVDMNINNNSGEMNFTINHSPDRPSATSAPDVQIHLIVWTLCWCLAPETLLIFYLHIIKKKVLSVFINDYAKIKLFSSLINFDWTSTFSGKVKEDRNGGTSGESNKAILCCFHFLKLNFFRSQIRNYLLL